MWLSHPWDGVRKGALQLWSPGLATAACEEKAGGESLARPGLPAPHSLITDSSGQKPSQSRVGFTGHTGPAK